MRKREPFWQPTQEKNSQNQRHPVLLVHGIWRQSGVFAHLSAYLQRRGWSVYTCDLSPNLGTARLEFLAQQVESYIRQQFSPQQPIDLVGLSMGGLVTRYYVQRLGGIQRVRRFVTISAPHHGTNMASLLNFTTYRQMRPNSDFLQDLNRDMDVLGNLQFSSIWTPWDFIIVPASSSRMPVGREFKVPVVAHGFMVRHPRSMAAVAEALSVPVEV